LVSIDLAERRAFKRLCVAGDYRERGLQFVRKNVQQFGLGLIFLFSALG
jgi:hypothetical protein